MKKILHDMEGVLHFAANRRLVVLNFLVPVEAVIAIGQSILRGARGNVVFHLREMLVIFDFITLFDSKISRICIYCVVIFTHQTVRLDDVMRVGCCGRYGWT